MQKANEKERDLAQALCDFFYEKELISNEFFSGLFDRAYEFFILFGLSIEKKVPKRVSLIKASHSQIRMVFNNLCPELDRFLGVRLGHQILTYFLCNSRDPFVDSGFDRTVDFHSVDIKLRADNGELPPEDLSLSDLLSNRLEIGASQELFDEHYSVLTKAYEKIVKAYNNLLE